MFTVLLGILVKPRVLPVGIVVVAILVIDTFCRDAVVVKFVLF